MWTPYFEPVRKRLSQALHILDRFHIRKQLNKAVDDEHILANLLLAHADYIAAPFCVNSPGPHGIHKAIPSGDFFFRRGHCSKTGQSDFGSSRFATPVALNICRCSGSSQFRKLFLLLFDSSRLVGKAESRSNAVRSIRMPRGAPAKTAPVTPAAVERGKTWFVRRCWIRL